MKVIGLSSGTSADGIDAVVAEISGRGENISVQLIAYQTYPYPRGLQKKILAIASHQAGGAEAICSLNVDLGELFARAACRIVEKSGVPMEEIGCIGSHGQTICHLPARHSTLQIGEPSVIAERTGLSVVADFRPRDIAAGGEGAPLSSYLHFLLFSHPERSRLLLNIGGIANMTYLHSGGKLSDVVGFDTGPGNMVIDGIIQRGSEGRIDREGRIALKGAVHQGLLSSLMRHPFIHKPPPKSTGRETFGTPFIDRMLREGRRRRLSFADCVATATALTGEAIAANVRKFILPSGGIDEVIVSGGGSRNLALMERISLSFPGKVIKNCEDFGFPTGSVEALAFALMAYLAILGEPNILPGVTGAQRALIAGKILPKNLQSPSPKTSPVPPPSDPR